MIADIRHSLSLVTTLPDPLQREARDAYAASLRTVFIVAACSTLTAYLVRLPVRPPSCVFVSFRLHFVSSSFVLVSSRLSLTQTRTRFRKKRWSTTTTRLERPTPSLRRTWMGVWRDEGRSPRGAERAREGQCYYNNSVSSSTRDVWTGW